MATKKSRKLKKADRALNAAAKLLAKAEKKRDSVLAREKAKLDKKLDRKAKKQKPAAAKSTPAAKAAKPTPAAKAAKPAPAKTAPAAKPATKTVPAANTETPAAASKPAFTSTNTVAELREAAKANSVAGYSSMTKAQLLAALN